MSAPEETAKKLIALLYPFSLDEVDAKHCALICIDMVLAELKSIDTKIHWLLVKKEIEKL